MQLPPCRPMLPAAARADWRRQRPALPLARISPCRLQLNLTWLLDLLEAVPGQHQKRIAASGKRRSRDSREVQIAAAGGEAEAALIAGGISSSSQQHGISKEDLGRHTWTFLHTLAAQWPEHPTRQQQKDVASLVDVLTRIYPCGECAAHLKELVRHNPPTAMSRQELEQWMCAIHNSVNDSLGKPQFNCRVAGLRWPAVTCEGAEVCTLSSTKPNK